MKIVLAPDKFKNSLTGMEFCTIVSRTIKNELPDAEIINLPLADGGDGTIDVANYYLGGEMIKVEVINPYFEVIEASYLFAEPSKTAFIEMAEASGLKAVKNEKPDCKNATTLGTGQLIKHAIEKGATTIILGIGGSATNDCGIGMATALGYRFLDENNKELKPIGANLSKIISIDGSQVYSNLADVTFDIACDVSNSLYGANGAAHVYAKQKGATDQDIELLDKGLEDFSEVLDGHFNIKSQEIKGAGAAGGMGIASIAFLNGTLSSGIDLIKRLAKFDRAIKDVNWIITGEGKLDEQTFAGKTINGVMQSAKENKIQVAAFCGVVELSEQQLKIFGVSYADEIVRKSNDQKDALQNTKIYLEQIANDFTKSHLV